MVTTKDIHPIIYRSPNSEAIAPDAAIAATPSGGESIYLGPLQDTEGKTAHLRVSRTGFRALMEISADTWGAVPPHNNVHGVPLGTANVGMLSQLKITLKALDFVLSEESEAFLEKLPGSAAAAYSVVRAQRSKIPAEYLSPEVQALREYSDGASVFRGY